MYPEVIVRGQYVYLNVFRDNKKLTYRLHVEGADGAEGFSFDSVDSNGELHAIAFAYFDEHPESL